MSCFSKDSFYSFILENNVVGFFDKPITLVSGRVSHWYVNWRSVTQDVFLADILADYLINFVQDCFEKQIITDKPQSYFGVPEGATKIGLLTQYKSAIKEASFAKGSHTLAMGRGKAKEHGAPKDRHFLGVPTGKTVVIEDVTTTGSSLLKSLDILSEAGVDVIAAIGLTNRMEKRDDGLSVAQAIAQQEVSGRSIPYLSLSSALELLPQLCKQHDISLKIRQAVEKEFADFGVQKLSLS